MINVRRTCLFCAVVAVACCAVVAASCSGGSSTAPTTPSTTMPAAPSQPSVGGSVAATCALGPGSTGASCGRHSSRLTDRVIEAMDLLLTQQPRLFDKSDEATPAGSGNYRVLDANAFIEGVLVNLRSAGLCAQRDPDDYAYEQIQVKSENGYSEDFDILLGSGHMWHSGASYRRTCTPASFPVERSADLPPVGSGCGRPYPPAIHHFWANIHINRAEWVLLDSTPVIGADGAYCAAMGWTDGRLFCPVRPEGHPERLACENWRVGNAEDTGRPGPTWKRDGRFCTGPQSGCEHYSENPYQLLVYKSGTYTVCATNGACGEIVVKR